MGSGCRKNVLAPQTSTDDNRLDPEKKNNPLSFPRRWHQTSNSSQKHRRRYQPWNSITVKTNGSSAIIRATSLLGSTNCINPRNQNPRSDLPQGDFAVAMAISDNGQPIKSPSPWNIWSLCWHSHPCECLDLWRIWLAEHGQCHSTTGVLGSDGKLGSIIISASRRNTKISVNSRRCKQKTIQHQFEARHISPRPGINGERLYIPCSVTGVLDFDR